MRKKRLTEQKFVQITRFLFITTQAFALFWVTLSYAIAAYSTVVLGQPFPVETLSGQAIETLLGVAALKVIENIFEHNEGGLFGHTRAAESEEPDYERYSEEADLP